MNDTFDKRFYGIYMGICFDNADPEKRYRLQLQVPQILGTSVTEWALPCLPVTGNSNHPDHEPHTAAQVAALLTTTSASITDSRGDTATVPALTVVAKAGAGTLVHPHKTTSNVGEKWNDELETNVTAEHTPHRLVPKLGQKVWIMFIAGDPNFPVWIGVLP